MAAVTAFFRVTPSVTLQRTGSDELKRRFQHAAAEVPGARLLLGSEQDARHREALQERYNCSANLVADIQLEEFAPITILCNGDATRPMLPKPADAPCTAPYAAKALHCNKWLLCLERFIAVTP